MRTFFLIAFFLLPATSFAAEFRFETAPVAPRAGDIFIVDLFLDTHSDVVNAFEGALTFSPNLGLRDIRLSGSLVPLWISPPKEKEAGVVEFAGVMPGGYQGSPPVPSRGNVFTLVFQALDTGPATITLSPQTALYLNDGKGTRAELAVTPLSLILLPSSGLSQEAVLEKDVTPPEPFVPLRIPGEPFGYTSPVLIFSTQDKDSGILRFELARAYNKYAKEGNLSWKEVESPYVLAKEDADPYLFVRAVDRAGNTQVVVVAPERTSIMTLLYTWWPTLILLLFFGATLYRYCRSRL